jgi:hypothetical protein
MHLYHSTKAENASRILSEGFRDHTDYYMTDELHTGVWLSDRPLDENEGAASGALLIVELDGAVVTPYEWIEEGKPYRGIFSPPVSSTACPFHGCRTMNERCQHHPLRDGELPFSGSRARAFSTGKPEKRRQQA